MINLFTRLHFSESNNNYTQICLLINLLNLPEKFYSAIYQIAPRIRGRVVNNVPLGYLVVIYGEQRRRCAQGHRSSPRLHPFIRFS